MKKIYESPTLKVRKVNIAHHLLIGSDTQNVGISYDEKNPEDADNSLAKESWGSVWE